MSDFRLQRDSDHLAISQKSGICSACGAVSYYDYVPVINAKLGRQWRMSKEQREAMSARESMYCLYCGSSYRLRLLARAVNSVIKGSTAQSLEESIDSGTLDTVKVAEINSCGVLHEILKKIPKIQYSEYVPSSPGVQHQDLQKLTYKTNSFDIVLTSDVLEHVPDVRQALAETLRVLKPGGVHIMTVPLLMDRDTKTRATIKSNGEVSYVSEQSFHGAGQSDYLVWSEFGRDFVTLCREVGFDAYYLFNNTQNDIDMPGVVIAIKPGKNAKIIPKLPDNDRNDHPVSEWQAKKTAELAHKLKLTNEHVGNLQELLDACVADNDNKEAYIRLLQSQGLRYHLHKKLTAKGRPKGDQ